MHVCGAAGSSPFSPRAGHALRSEESVPQAVTEPRKGPEAADLGTARRRVPLSPDRRPFGDDAGRSTSVIPDTSPAAEPASGRCSRVLCLGGDAPRRAFAHAVLARLAAAHPAGELRIALRVAPGRQADWAWTRWLPHARREDAGFEQRPPFTPDVRPRAEEPLVVVVLDGVEAGDRPGGFRNTVVLDLDGRRRRPGRTTLR